MLSAKFERISSVAILTMGILAVSVPAYSMQRVALVIGNAAYEYGITLTNPVNDATDIGNAFERLGFNVTRVENAGREEFINTLKEFGGVASTSEIAVVFYAGHGMEVDLKNYLIPVDAELKSDRDVMLETISLDMIMNTVNSASVLRLVILDACRNNPFASSMKRTSATRTSGKGLARVEPPDQTLVAYAAEAGTEASDGVSVERNSPYTKALLAYVEQSGLEIVQMFREIRDAVKRETGDSQVPYMYGSLSAEGVYLSTAPVGIVQNTSTDATISNSIELDSRRGTLLSLHNDVPLRVTPSLTANFAGDIQQGQEVQFWAQTRAKDWYQVRVGGQLAYVLSEYVIESKKTNKHMIALQTMSVFNIPDLTGKKKLTVEQGDLVVALAKLESWYKVNVDGEIGFLPSNMVRDWKNEQIGVVMAAKNDIRLYKVPSVESLSSGALVIEKNFQLQVLSQDAEWYMVHYENGHFYTPVGGMRDLQCRMESRRTLVNARREVSDESSGYGRTRTRCRNEAGEFAIDSLWSDCSDLDARGFNDMREDFFDGGDLEHIGIYFIGDSRYGLQFSIRSDSRILEWDREDDYCWVEFTAICRYRRNNITEVEVCA